MESTAQIAGKLPKSISSLVAYMINDIYLLSGDMQDRCCCGLLIEYASTLVIFGISVQKPFLWTLVEND